jgi:UDP-glucuronate 4-epimerase
MGEIFMNILITGGSGFIGRHLITKLIELGHKCHNYDLTHNQDIRNLHDLDKAFELSQCSTVIHLAARAGVRRGNEYPEEYITTNIGGTWNVTKMCEKYHCRLISFSSSSVYGHTNPPTKEDDPKEPISLYGMTKLAGEFIVNAASIPTTIIRPFTVYGENGRGDQVFYKWLNQYKAGKLITVFRDPDILPSKRGYTYVEDLVYALMVLVETRWTWDHNDFNLGGQEVINIDDMVNIFMDCIPDFWQRIMNVPPPEEDIQFSYACVDKAREILGFDPPARFREIVRQIIINECNA